MLFELLWDGFLFLQLLLKFLEEIDLLGPVLVEFLLFFILLGSHKLALPVDVLSECLRSVVLHSSS